MFGKQITFNAHGHSEFQVIKSPPGWFVGYYRQADDGNHEAQRMSQYYPSPEQAEDVLSDVLQQRQAA